MRSALVWHNNVIGHLPLLRQVTVRVAERDELVAPNEAKGLSTATVRTVAEELTDHNAFAAHAEVEVGIDPDDQTSPLHAALSSALSFTVGALLPLIAILLPPIAARSPVTVAAVLVVLVVTGAVSASVGGVKA